MDATSRLSQKKPDTLTFIGRILVDMSEVEIRFPGGCPHREDGLFSRIERENASILDGLKVAMRNPIDDASPIAIDLKLHEGLPVAMRLA
ncbi:hypothetical protein U1872_12810 [Sphingomonas sp. RB3P16]|uniref:hypothetical protein n=1 Tax=Parasphingomonas frigoris TaxID=3096163 RepID=UPI002FCB3710